MLSTISGLASVVMSPGSVKLEIPAMTRRMIFPERVFGMSETIQTFFGRAIFPIIDSDARRLHAHRLRLFAWRSTPLRPGDGAAGAEPAHQPASRDRHRALRRPDPA